MTKADVSDLLSQASLALRRGDRDSYRAYLERVVVAEPGHAQARNALGNDALARGDVAAAARHFEAAAESDPGADVLWMNLASARRKLGDDAGEQDALERVLRLDQRHLMAIIRLAELHERRGEEPQAYERWSAVVALAPHFPDVPADLQERFVHARAFAGERGQRIASQVDELTQGHLSAATPRDRRRLLAARDAMLGRRAIFANQPHGFHYPFLPADEYFDKEHFPWLAKLEAATDMIREELLAILASDDPGLYPYINMGDGFPETKWTALDRNLDWSSLHLWNEGTRVDEACARAPKTAALIESLPLAQIPHRAPTAFFSILKAGKHIPPHTGVTNTRAIIHLPLIVPGDCAFRVGGETREWVEGEAFAFDDTIEHEAWNRSDRDRAVLIVDTWNPHLSEAEREAIAAMFAAADSAGLNPRGS